MPSGMPAQDTRSTDCRNVMLHPERLPQDAELTKVKPTLE